MRERDTRSSTAEWYTGIRAPTGARDAASHADANGAGDRTGPERLAEPFAERRRAPQAAPVVTGAGRCPVCGGPIPADGCGMPIADATWQACLARCRADVDPLASLAAAPP